MKGDDGNTATRFQYSWNLLQHFFQRTHFIVHLNSQSLEYLGQVLIRISFHHGTDQRFKLLNGCRLQMLPFLHNMFSKCFRIGYFSILFKQFVQLLFVVTAYNISGSRTLSSVHTHIQRSGETDRKTTVAFIKLMAAYTKICQHTIYFADLMQTKHALQVTEILRHKNYARIFRHIFLRIRILVKSNQFSFSTQLFQYSFAMSTATKCAIHIHTIGLNG